MNPISISSSPGSCPPFQEKQGTLVASQIYLRKRKKKNRQGNTNSVLRKTSYRIFKKNKMKTHTVFILLRCFFVCALFSFLLFLFVCAKKKDPKPPFCVWQNHPSGSYDQVINGSIPPKHGGVFGKICLNDRSNVVSGPSWYMLM